MTYFAKISYHQTMEILNGKIVAQDIKNQIKIEIESRLTHGKKPPCLACIIVGDNPASQVYVSSKVKACNAVGMKSIVRALPENASESEVISVINQLNNDDEISAILLQLPLPKGLDERKILNYISPKKDADGLTDILLGKLFAGTNKIAPCTASGIIKILDAYNIDPCGKRAVVIGRSLLVGKSVAVLLEERNATVTVCHSKTKNLADITKEADILIVAIGKEKFVKADMIKLGATVIDVGINRTDNGIVGDVDYENVKENCSFITPVPGGVGPMTIAMLLSNTLELEKDREV